MICPKCGAKLVDGTTVCPICGSKQRPRTSNNNNNGRNGSRSTGSRQTKSSATKSAPAQAREQRKVYKPERRYDDEYDDYDDYDEYEEKRPRRASIGILIAVIVTGVIIMGVLVALIITQLRSRDSRPDVPQTVEQQEVTQDNSRLMATTEAQTEEESTTIEEDGDTITSGKNVYKKNDDGLTLVEYNSSSVVATIPEEIGGYKVTRIGSHAFKGNTSVTYVSLPDSVKTLETFALYDLTGLKEIYIPDSVTEILTYAFSRVDTCVTPENSFAYTHMQRIANKVVIGNALSIDPNTIGTVTLPTTSTTTATPTQPTVAPTQPTVAPTQPTVAPTQPSETQPTAPSETQPTAPSETQPTAPSETQPTAPSETQPTAPSETQTPEPSETQTPEPSETQPAETERNANTVREDIVAVSGGNLADYQYMTAADGSEVAFALTQAADGTYSVWFNSQDGGTVQMQSFPAGSIVNASLVDLGAGLNYIVTGAGTTSIFSTDGHSCTPIATSLPGELDQNSMTLQSATGTAYLTVADGTYKEYTASQVSREQVAALTGGSAILDLIDSTIGDTSAATFWNRANGMIQINMPDGTHFINLWRNGSSLSLSADATVTSGNIDLRDGQVSSAVTGFEAITPQELPQALTTTVTVGEGSAASYDINGDGTQESLVWSREQNADGLYNLVVTVDGQEKYRSTSTAASYTVELCDLDSSTAGYDVVIYSAGGVSGNSVEIYNGNFNMMLSLANGWGILQGMGSFSEVGMSAGHILTDVNGSGSFGLIVANPIAGMSTTNYYVKIPYLNYVEDTTKTEYDIVDMTGAGSATLVRDVTVYDSASLAAGAQTWATGTAIVPRKLVYSEGSFFLYTEVPSAGYIQLDGTAIY